MDPYVAERAGFDHFLHKDVQFSPTRGHRIELGLSSPSSLGPSASFDTTLVQWFKPEVTDVAVVTICNGSIQLLKRQISSYSNRIALILFAVDAQ